MGVSGKLSALRVAKEAKVGRYGDGGGLWLQCSAYGTKSWIFRFTVAGKERHFGLGSVHDVSLAEAREAARECRRLVRDGVDPIEHRKAKLQEARAAAAAGVTFDECAERYIKAHEASWKNDKHRAQWRATLSTYASPVFGALDVAAVDTGLVLKVIEPLWQPKTETASRLRGRIEQVLDWAAVRGYRPAGDNPARWRGHFDKLLPPRGKIAKPKHHAAMKFDDVPAFVTELRGMRSVSARALEFVIMTAGRTGEILGATWDEFDIENRLWTIPGSRMKAGVTHSVPLTDDMVALLKALPREEGNSHAFIGGKKGAGLSNMSLLMLLRGARPDSGLTSHGFRSAFRDWCAERTTFPAEVAEMALAHRIENRVEAAYRRGALLEKRRQLMTAWCGFVGGAGAAAGAKVSPLRKRTA